MSDQWLRTCSVEIEGSGQKLAVSDLRVRFNIKQGTTQSPDTAVIVITNLSEATAQKIQNAAAKKTTQTVKLTAGYQTAPGLIFKGNIQESRKGRENPTDTILTIWAASGDAGYNFAPVNKSLAKGSTPQDHHNALMEAFKPFGILPGYVPPGLLTQFKNPRSVPLYGMARDHMRKLAQSLGCSWSITDDKLDLVPIGKAKPGNATVINANTGMIGMPMQTQQGVVVKCLINPLLRPKQTIKLDNKSIQLSSYDQSNEGAKTNFFVSQATLSADGTYIILAIDMEGDTRGGPWYQELICYARGGAIPPGATNYTTAPSYAA